MLLYNIYLQIMVQKALSARSLTDAQGATILTGWIKVLPMFLIVVPGMISRVLFPNEVGCANPERVICTKIPFHNIFRYVKYVFFCMILILLSFSNLVHGDLSKSCKLFQHRLSPPCTWNNARRTPRNNDLCNACCSYV